MTLLNLCCGATRVVDDTWINLDSLHDTLAKGTPERANLDAEPNYVNYHIPNDGKMPFSDAFFDGIVASHCFEHWELHQAIGVMRECRRILKLGGMLIVSVPDATVFRQKYDQDIPENAVSLFGEPIYLPDGETTFMGYAGFNRFHKTLLSEDSLWCYFRQSGFPDPLRIRNGQHQDLQNPSVTEKLTSVLNRIPFSLIMAARK